MKSIARPAILAVLAVLMLFFEYADVGYSADTRLNGIIGGVVTRTLGSAIFLILLVGRRYRILNPFRRPFVSSLLFILPSLLVVINNLPIIALATGNAYVEASSAHYFFFALECFLIGLFEESAFRGVFFLILLEGARDTRRRIFNTVVWTSAVFGGVHLFNLFMGAGVGPTLLQVGYSFLIGGMCAIVLLRTKNIWFCVLLHAVYDFCGFLVERLGGGRLWDTPTVIITALLAAAVSVFMIISLLRIRPEDVADIFPEGEISGRAEG